MNKPRKRPLSIRKLAGFGTLEIEALTDDADVWTQKHTTEFGQLIHDPVNPKRWLLFVYHGYDPSETIDYLRDLWDSQSWPGEM